MLSTCSYRQCRTSTFNIDSDSREMQALHSLIQPQVSVFLLHLGALLLCTGVLVPQALESMNTHCGSLISHSVWFLRFEDERSQPPSA